MQQNGHKSVSNAGNIYLIFLGFLLFLMGAGFMAIMWVGYQRASLSRVWTETPCVILRSSIRTEERTLERIEYQWDGEYAYTFNGSDYRTTKFGVRSNKWSSQRDRIEEIVEQFPAGEARVCYVNPDDPNIAILKHDSKAAGYNVWFPGLFAIGGLGMMVGAVRKWNKKV